MSVGREIYPHYVSPIKGIHSFHCWLFWREFDKATAFILHILQVKTKRLEWKCI